MRYPYTIFILTHRQQQQQHCTADSFSSKFTSIKKYELALFTPEFTVGRNQPEISLAKDTVRRWLLLGSIDNGLCLIDLGGERH